MAIMVRNIFSIYTKLTTIQSACAERCQSKSLYHETKIKRGQTAFSWKRQGLIRPM